MRKLISLIIVLVLALGVSFAADSYNYLDNNAVRKASTKADTSAWFSCTDYETIALFWSGYAVTADSAIKCSLIVDLKYAGTGAAFYKTLAGTKTAADSTWYTTTIKVDTTGAYSFRYRIVNWGGDSAVFWSGFRADPKFR
jgi:hypothetical protein